MKIKITFAFIFFFGIITIKVFSQSPCKTDVIRTNPNGTICDQPGDTTAFNREKPSKRNCNPLIFNWTEEFFSINSSYYTGDKYSPFFQNDNYQVRHFLDTKDMYSKDGWELIKKDLGYNDDGTPYQVGNPYFVLYNRYTGILRTFIAIGRRENDYNSMRFTLSFIKPKNQDLNTQLINEFEMDKPLRAVNDYLVSQSFSVTNFNNDDARWFYADFPVYYDPCTCYFRSTLHIKVHLIESSQIDLIGEETGEITSVENKSGTIHNEKQSWAFSDVSAAAKKANESFKTFNDFNTNFNNSVDVFYTSDMANANNQKEQNEALERKNERKNLFQTTLNWVAGKNSVLRQLSNFAGPMGAVLGILDFFSGGGKDETPQGPLDVKVQPMAVRLSTKLSGTTSATNEYKSITFNNPGSDNLNFDLADYPYYNQVMGIFNLLRKPVIESYKYHIWDMYEPPQHGSYSQSILRFRLRGDDLKYVINPASGFKTSADDIEILASVVFTLANESDYNCIKYGQDNSFIVRDGYKSFRTQFIPLECLENTLIRLTDESFIQPAGVDTTCLFIPSFESIHLKLAVGLHRSDENSNIQPVLFSGTYKLDEVGVDSATAMSWNTNNSYYGSLNINFSNNTLQTNLSAWDRVIIGPNVDLKDDEHVTINAGNEIDIIPSNVHLKATNNSSAHLKIGLPIACNNSKKPPLTDLDSLYTFCHSNSPYNYNPDARRFFKPNDTGFIEDQMNKIVYFYDIVPNPANAIINIKYFNSYITDIKISIKDLFGNEIIELLNNRWHDVGKHELYVDISGFVPGIYFITYNSSSYIEVKKLIVLR